jgi:ABC-type transport system involved in cytochrome c biogenesis permease subunit
MDQLTRYFPYGVVVLAAVALIVVMAPPQDSAQGMQLAQAGQLPVMDGGRVKPLEGYARTTLMQISSRQSWYDGDGHEHSAVEWLFDVVSSDTRHAQKLDSEDQPAFRIDSPRLRQRWGLPDVSNKKLPDGRERKDPYAYTLRELGPALTKIAEEGKDLFEAPPEKLDADQLKVKELFGQLLGLKRFAGYETPHKVFRIENDQVVDLLMLERRPGSYRYSFGEILPRLSLLIGESGRAAAMPDESRSVYDTKVLETGKKVERYLGLANLSSESLRVVPPAEGDQGWKAFDEAGDDAPIHRLVTLYRAHDADGFNKELGAYRARLEGQMPSDVQHASFEAFFNHAEPFYQSTWLFACVFLLACASWVGWSEPLRRAAFWLMVLTLVMHTAALFARMYLMNRPLVFITNLYSTAIFIGWVGALFGLGIECIFRRGIGLAVGGMLGFLTAIVAHNLATGDTLEQVVAVLDTNFWLATHVTIINAGYGATFVAGLLGAGLILAGVLTRGLDRPTYRLLGQILYGALCFATLFSFVGTVLGGIWADQSWGRFWGWDPKENGALLIVLMNALILHARWAGLVHQRGMAVLAVLGNILVIWSWFGVNMLGVGLHSYGFIPSTFYGMLVADFAHVCIAAVGLVPLRHWRSYAALNSPSARQATAPAPPAGRRARRGKGHSTAITPA